MTGSGFRPFEPPPALAQYVRAANLNLVDAEPEDGQPWALMFVREVGGFPFAAVRTSGMNSEEIERSIAIAVAHSVLDHRGDFVHAADGAALVAPSPDQAAAAVRYGALLRGG